MSGGTSNQGLGVPAPLRQGLAGAVAGALVFVLLEPGMRAAEADPSLTPDSLLQGLLHVLLLGVLFGGIVSGFLMAADELPSGRAVRVVLRGLTAAVIGAMLGCAASIAGNIVYSILGILGRQGILQIAARTAGWALFGLGIGFTAGAVSRSMRRTQQGALGGLIGGCIGGALFDVLSLLTREGTLSRLVGFVVLAGLVGLATALVEELRKQAWVTLLSGAREGRQILLHRDTLLLGRDELVDIPLFGDAAVERRHAVLQLSPVPGVREIASAALLRVNGHPMREAVLSDGDVLELGRHRIRFHYRTAGTPLPNAGFPEGAFPGGSPPPPASGLPPSPWQQPTPPFPSPGTPGQRGPMTQPAYPTAAIGHAVSAGEWDYRGVDGEGAPPPAGRGGLLLRVHSGPLAGTRIPVPPSGLTVGRETTNDLALPDARVSRFHARVEGVDGAWMLVDLNSTNGTRLNGMPVSRAGITPGDYVYLGDTIVAVEAG